MWATNGTGGTLLSKEKWTQALRIKTAASMTSEALALAFEHGDMELKGQFTLGSNYSFYVTIQYEQKEFQAVYKPQKGEQPLWDFPENSLAGREVAAYLVSQALGWGIVPYTMLRTDAPLGPGSLQHYIEYDPNYHYFNFKPEDKACLRPVVIFDSLTNNADRKGSHVFFEKNTRHLYAIDHGLCFNVDDKLRTVIWDFAGEPIAPDLLSALGRLRPLLCPPAALYTDLLHYLSPDEIAALDLRAEALITSGEFPNQPHHRRAHPYPPL
jgi:uncharacterized repeat protein (TIGR03843 family)